MAEGIMKRSEYLNDLPIPLSVFRLCRKSAEENVTATQLSTPRLAGIHHIKFPVSDLARSQRFYEMALNAKRVHQFDHRRPGDGTLFGIVMDIPGLGTFLELRLNPHQAAAQAGFD